MFRLLADLTEGLRTYRHYRTVLRELRSYSVAELNDLGVAPADIGRLALEEAERRTAAERRPEPARMPDGAMLAGG